MFYFSTLIVLKGSYHFLYLVVTIQGYMCGFKDNMMGSHRVIASVEQNSSNFRIFYFHCLNECI